jgi:hypothetical protein
MRKAEDIVSFAIKERIEDPLEFLRKTFHPNFNVASLQSTTEVTELLKVQTNRTTNLDLYFRIDDCSKSKEKKVCKDMPRIFRNMKEHLKAFEEFRDEPITFDCLDLNFYEELAHSCHSGRLPVKYL